MPAKGGTGGGHQRKVAREHARRFTQGLYTTHCTCPDCKARPAANPRTPEERAARARIENAARAAAKGIVSVHE